MTSVLFTVLTEIKYEAMYLDKMFANLIKDCFVEYIGNPQTQQKNNSVKELKAKDLKRHFTRRGNTYGK